MKVGLAREVLSWNVGQCLSLVSNAQGTSEYTYFDVCKVLGLPLLRTSKDFEVVITQLPANHNLTNYLNRCFNNSIPAK